MNRTGFVISVVIQETCIKELNTGTDGKGFGEGLFRLREQLEQRPGGGNVPAQGTESGSFHLEHSEQGERGQGSLQEIN